MRVSVDHSLVQELVDAGQITEEEARVHPERHIVTRALGGPDALDPDFFVLPLADAERILLCSDGVTGMIATPRSPALLADNADPRDAADGIVAARWPPAASTTPPRSSSMWWDWPSDRTDDSRASARVCTRSWGACRDRDPHRGAG